MVFHTVIKWKRNIDKSDESPIPAGKRKGLTRKEKKALKAIKRAERKIKRANKSVRRSVKRAEAAAAKAKG